MKPPGLFPNYGGADPLAPRFHDHYPTAHKMTTISQSLIDWEAIAIRNAAAHLGTPEGEAFMAEARRYRFARAELEATENDRLRYARMNENNMKAAQQFRDERDRLATDLRNLIMDLFNPAPPPGNWSEHASITNARESLDLIYPHHRMREDTAP